MEGGREGWKRVDLGGVCGTGVGCGYGEWVGGVESGVRVLWVEGLEVWRRKSPKKIQAKYKLMRRQSNLDE